MRHRMIKIYFLVCLIAISIGCSKNEVQEEQILVTKEQLIGVWNSTHIIINGKPIEDYQDKPFSVSHIMGLRENDFYFFNYNSGVWDLEGNTIKFDNLTDFEILKYDGDAMIIKTVTYEQHVYSDLNGIEPNELIIIQEYFTRD